MGGERIQMWEENTNGEKLQIRKICSNNKDTINRRITMFNNLRNGKLTINAKTKIALLATVEATATV